MTKSKKIKAFFTIFILAAAIGLVVYFFPYITPKWQTLTIELGEVPPSEIGEYLDGAEWVLERTTFDASQIDSGNVGVYEVTSSFLWRNYVQEVEIVDTTAPTLKIDVPDILQTNTTYLLEDFIVEVVDNSNNVDVYFELNGENSGEALFYGNAGSYNGSVVAIDAHGNETKVDFSTNFDDPPYFVVLPPNQYVGVNNEEYDPQKLIVAYDDTDDCRIEDLDIQGEYDISTIGTYDVSCVVQDSYGFKTTQNFTIDVVENKTTAIEKQNEYVLSREQLEMLVDMDYFKYRPLEEEDEEAVVELVKPTLVYIKVKINPSLGYSQTRVEGCAFVYHITTEETKILSVNHVTELRQYGSTDVVFFDDNRVPLPSSHQVKHINVSGNELTMFEINTSEIPFTTIMMLKQVWYDDNIYDELKTNEKAINVCQWPLYARNDFRVHTGTILPNDKTELAKKEAWRGLTDVVMTNHITQVGVSGSALMDLRGRLLGVASWEFPQINVTGWSKVDKIAAQWGDNGSIKD